MRWLRRLTLKFIKMLLILALMGVTLRYARPYIMKAAGMSEGGGLETAHFSSDESDLMATVFKSALRFLSGSAKREELASELSDKLYANRADSKTMSELSIELVKPKTNGSAPVGSSQPLIDSAAARSSRTTENSVPGKNVPAITTASSATRTTGSFEKNMMDQVWEKAIANPELVLLPVLFCAMILVPRFRRRSPEDDLALPDLSKLIPSEAERYDMANPVHSLHAEEFELFVARIYQLQGYRISMPA